MFLAIYRVAIGGSAVWTETHNAVAVNAGIFNLQLGSVAGFPPGLFDGSSLYVGVTVGADSEMTPRFAITSQVYSQLAANAKDVKGADIHPNSVTIGAQPVIDSTGKWVGSPTGLQGPKGDTGPQGPKGDTGAAGESASEAYRRAAPTTGCRPSAPRPWSR